MVEARRRSTRAIVQLAIPGDRDKERAFERRLLAHAPGKLVAAHFRQADVEERYVGPVFLRNGEAAAAVARHAHLVAIAFEEQAQRLRRVAVVIDDENAAAHAALLSGGTF